MANLGKSVKGKSRAKKMKKQDATAKKAATAEDADLAARVHAMNRKLLRAALSREMEMTKLNKQKVTQAWLKIMRLSKVDELRRDVEVVSQAHERDVDRKDAVLQMLDRDLDEAEEQYQMALRQHLRSIDRLIEVQDEKLQVMEKEFDTDLEVLAAEFTEERAAITAQHAAEKRSLESLVAVVDAEEKEKTADMKQEHESLKEETRGKHVERINTLSAQLDQQIEDLQRAFEAAHLSYLHETDSNTEEFKNLTSLDKAAARSIEVKLRLINKTQRAVDEWKAKLAATDREYSDKNSELEKEKGSMAQHTKRLKSRMAQISKFSNARLVTLSKDVAATTEALQERAALAERILKSMERCRLMETEVEKVVPFAGPAIKADGGDSDVGDATYAAPLGTTKLLGLTAAASAAAEAESKERQVPSETTAKLPEGAVRDLVSSDELSALENFHKKYNKVLLDKLTLEREKERLAQENAKYQAVLKQYLEGVSVPTDAVDSDNTLLMVNGRTSRVKAPPAQVRHAPPAVVEAHHMVQTGRAGVARK